MDLLNFTPNFQATLKVNDNVYEVINTKTSKHNDNRTEEQIAEDMYNAYKHVRYLEHFKK